MSGRLAGKVWDSALPSRLKPLAATLADFAYDDGSNLHPSVARLAWRLGRSERPVQVGLAELRGMGVLVTVRRERWRYQPTEYRFVESALPSRAPWNIATARGAAGDVSGPLPATARGAAGDVSGPLLATARGAASSTLTVREPLLEPLGAVPAPSSPAPPADGWAGVTEKPAAAADSAEDAKTLRRGLARIVPAADLRLAGDLLKRCRAVVSDVTASEVLGFAEIKACGVNGGARNMAGLLLATVPGLVEAGLAELREERRLVAEEEALRREYDAIPYDPARTPPFAFWAKRRRVGAVMNTPVMASTPVAQPATTPPAPPPAAERPEPMAVIAVVKNPAIEMTASELDEAVLRAGPHGGDRRNREELSWLG
jgi:hypothetical protein